MGLPGFLEDPRLRHFADRARIDCEKLFEYACPAYWGGLRETDDPGVRACDQCQENVYFTSTAQELLERTARGQCVAVMMESEAPSLHQVQQANESPPGIMMMGRVEPMPVDTD